MPSNEDIATAFTALSHKRRILIFRILQEEGQLTHKALQTRTGFRAMTLSHHLGPMVAAGLVSRRIRGPYPYLSLRPGPWRETIDTLLPLRKLTEPTLARLHTATNKPCAY